MDKYIHIERKFFTKDKCQKYINYFKHSNDKYENSRGYTGVYCQLNHFNGLGNELVNVLKKYHNKHKFLNRHGTEVPSQFHLQKYIPGECYSIEHMENGIHEDDCKRILGWMIYLNDIKQGGGTRWPQQNFTSKAREGDLYIWPSGWTHSHHGIIAPNEIKYIATGWCAMHR